MYVCSCKALTESQVRRVAGCGEATAETLIRSLKLDDDDCCGRCVLEIDELVALAQDLPMPVLRACVA